jgi:excisionase family DNA binding protein
VTTEHIERRALTIAEFMKRYSLGRSHTDKLIREGAIIARKLGPRHIRIDADSAETWWTSLPDAGRAA